MADRLIVDVEDGVVSVLAAPGGGGLAEERGRVPFGWPLDADDLGELRWYLEDYLEAPFGVWEDRGPEVEAQLDGWGEQVFGSVFGGGPARFGRPRLACTPGFV